MNTTTLISIIIPVYNVEAYLHKCVTSVINQTYKNLEIILVNDGSTDTCGAICNEFAVLDDRIVVIHHKNSGLAEARNVGTACATGDYIFYLDSDDYLKLECIKQLFIEATIHNADIVQANFYYDYDTYLLFDNRLKTKTKKYTRDTAMWALLNQKEIKNFAWGKLMKANLAKAIKFEKGKNLEDTFWKYQLIHNCSNYIVLSKPLLYYLQRPTSISGSFSRVILDQIEGEALRLDFVKKNYNPLYYNKGLALFNEKILMIRQLIKKLPIDEKKWFNEQLNRYIDAYHLKEKFVGAYFIEKHIILRKLIATYTRIMNRIFEHKHWVKIYK